VSRTPTTGLGPKIVKQVTEAHGWEIDVTEGADDGALFEITGVEFVSIYEATAFPTGVDVELQDSPPPGTNRGETSDRQ
jgi:hypothetical protein